MNSRALCVTVVAPSKRPGNLYYRGGVKQQKEPTFGGENFLHPEGILSFNGIPGNINRPPASIDNKDVLPNLQRISLSRPKSIAPNLDSIS